MMNEQTIREQFLKIVPVLTAWGQYVQTYLSQLTHVYHHYSVRF